MIDLLQKEIRVQFRRYVTIGVINTGLDFAIYTLLTRTSTFWKEHYLFANALTFIIVVTWSFFWNKHWTFQNRERRHAEQYAKFLFSTLTGIAIAESILYLGVDAFGLHDILSKVIAAPFVVLWNFFAYRFWAFRVKKEGIRTGGSEDLSNSKETSKVGTDEYETP